ncbi:MAG: DUF1592 domain-containing protein [Planctomycetota bacterium]
MNQFVSVGMVVVTAFSLGRCLPVAGEDSASTGELARGSAPTLQQVREAGAAKSSFRDRQRPTRLATEPKPQLDQFKRDIAPALSESCLDCHGPDVQEGSFRVDALDPDLIHGDDVAWWLEVSRVLTNGEMPPVDAEPISDEKRAAIINWLASEIQTASAARRVNGNYSSFRRMTRYEYNYALQDLLGLPYDFAGDLPPETASEDGFTNCSEVLPISASQVVTYNRIARTAIRKATVRGDQPAPLHWFVSMDAAAERVRHLTEEDQRRRVQRLENQPEALAKELERQRQQAQKRPAGTHYLNRRSGEHVRSMWRYSGARYAWGPTDEPTPSLEESQHVAVLPAGQRLIVELGDSLPDRGLMRVIVRAAGPGSPDRTMANLRLGFGHQASNNSSAEETVSRDDVAIEGAVREYRWDVPLSEVTRNPMRGVTKLGETPNPSEYLKLHNTSAMPADLTIESVEVIAPAYQDWPPESHQRLLLDLQNPVNERSAARQILTQFMRRAWRGFASDRDVQRKVAMFETIRPHCNDFQEAVTEVLANVISSAPFLYLTRNDQDDLELASRLSMFLWCSIPDEELLDLATEQRLHKPDVLTRQVHRMLLDERSKRLAEHFTRGWLGLQLLDYLKVDKDAYPKFNAELQASMRVEPIEFFGEMVRTNASVIDFLHADYAMLNESLARHYGIGDIQGNHFRRVSLQIDSIRGGLLTQSGLLAMNSDGKDSHPLKRGIWLLSNLLNDPPPPPPPAVPEIDLADPKIAQMTLKERMEDHRNDPACMSCHSKIDPWGIAMENFDAVGRWRDEIGDQPVDASSRLFNRTQLRGMDGLKRFLLNERQDQFVRAMVHKMATYALGRPLSFQDHAAIDAITAEVRERGDGLADLIELIVVNDLFHAAAISPAGTSLEPPKP